MEASSSPRKKMGTGLTGAMFYTRRGSFTTAALAAVLAGILLFAFVQNYQKASAPAVVNTPVFVASGFIPRGTPVSVIASGQLLARTTVPSTHVQAGAIADPSVLRGEAATTDIYPGQQLTAADFTAASATIASQLTGVERAIAVPVDTAHGLIGFVHAGDHVDLMTSSSAAQGGVTPLAQNVVVLSVPSAGGGGVAGGSSASEVLLNVSQKQAAQLAFAADNGKIWLTLRPPVGALGTSGAAGLAPKR